MLYTICPRTRTGAFTQKFMIDCDRDFAVVAARHLFIDNSVNHIEIYEGKAPVMDCWGKPILYVYKDNVSEKREH